MSLISTQEAIIAHISNDRNPMFIGAPFSYYRDHYRAQISMLGFNREQAEAAVQDAVDMAALAVFA
jgi:hypothetical protein